MDYQGKPVFLTDSGDNATAGGAGYNTLVQGQQFAAIHVQASKLLEQRTAGEPAW
ncbi:hypothetical protein [Caproiciproducens faecalis]|uniref:Uncharacterized protein n=1 Tax=Caproiciproducens faecalis TaxID=2820301 RepID=A0ABS7DKY6_9FIRM|nr:hypothetical protein [Caproiciproducens faecalis]MBW7571954.1 hypothetical protein [Caproiciproducens faecalis]